MNKINLNNQKIAILGFGVEGKSLLKFLQKNTNSNITVFDQKKDLKIEGVEIKSEIKNLEKFDLVFRSPSILSSRKELISAQKISSLTNLFLELCPTQNVVGVTGTKGKGTTSSLIQSVLQKAGKKVFLGGNIGLPPLEFLEEIQEDDWVILELSSFQTMDLVHALHYAVLLMITSEHLDIHKNQAEYLSAKAQLVLRQTKQDFCFFNKDYLNTKKIAEQSFSQKIGFSAEDVLKKFPKIKPALLGKHNFENIAAMLAFSSIVNLPKADQIFTIESFSGLPYRLEKVANKKGICFINDSFSTTPETAIAALNSFLGKPVFWIAGGSSKNSDFSELVKIVQENKPRQILVFGEEGERLEKMLGDDLNLTNLGREATQSDLKHFLFNNIKKKDIVLLSPACASFGAFKNYKDRGEWFNQIAKEFC